MTHALALRAARKRARAPAQVWQLLVDVAGWPAWTELMREIKRLEDGPLTVGSRSRVIQLKGRSMVWMVTELERLRVFTLVPDR
ncbi:SRPBCC family protein [Mycobacterium haemophilum]|uniref:SRPBCC family protein n=1 Tax=Mycobacterium haemophilum TaxID=29311 RepID=UPI000B1DBB5B|nr:SRPBCC family protein [Mycobacterium haemophilum]